MTEWHLQVKPNVEEHRCLQVRVKPGVNNPGGDGAGGTPPPEMKPSSWYLLLKFVYLTSQLHHSLEVHPS